MTDDQKLVCALLSEDDPHIGDGLTMFEVMAVMHRAGRGFARAPEMLLFGAPATTAATR